MTDAADAYTHAALMSVRRSMFRKLKGAGLSQDQVTRLVARAASSAVVNTGVSDLATLAAAVGPLRAALATAAPANPALDIFDGVSSGLAGPVRDLLDPAV